jgi:hypothetical protein
MDSNTHNRLLKNAAKSLLHPMGCVQKGTSRTWFDSQPYWVGVVEFQPSSWAKGSYLNVGACWLWYEKDHATFDEGYRVASFDAYETDEQFTEAAFSLATRAREEVLKLREQFSNMRQIATHLKKHETVSIWQNYHAAVSAGLIADLDHALKRFSLIADAATEYPWIEEVQKRAARLANIVEDTQQFRSEVDHIVEKQRAHLKLQRHLK